MKGELKMTIYSIIETYCNHEKIIAYVSSLSKASTYIKTCLQEKAIGNNIANSFARNKKNNEYYDMAFYHYPSNGVKSYLDILSSEHILDYNFHTHDYIYTVREIEVE